MNDATRYTIETIDRKIVSITERIRFTINGIGTMTEKMNEIIVEAITKDCNEIQDLLKVRTTLLKY